MSKVIVTTDLKQAKSTRSSPRELMRSRHPDMFSDTLSEQSVSLAKPVFEYHLDTLTSRKQEYEFEHFCRKLAEKEICPNLRVQTGPTGGGDSKVDSETFPVSAEIAERWWVGGPSAGEERWAFAFSAKKAWQPKLRADVANVASTGRDYKRIYFFTNQFVSDKQRAKFEDELFQTFSIPVHIVDRSWIVERVYDHGHLSLAISALGIGGAIEEKRSKLGPRDAERIVELRELDGQIEDPTRYLGAKFQLVEDIIRAALLARGLERSRHEVEGRFQHAYYIAQGLAIPQQLQRIAYNRAWTAHWWFQDYSAFNSYYQEVENIVVQSSDANDFEKLVTLWHLLVTAAAEGVLSQEAAQVDARKVRLLNALRMLSEDESRPNNALHAKTSIVFIKVFEAASAEDIESLDEAWKELANIVDQSDGMGQYPLELLSDMVREFGKFFDGCAFDGFYEKIVATMRQRRSDGEAGQAYLDRGMQKLEHGKPYDAIRWLGRAEELFIKDEYQRELVMTLVTGSLAYERAGLLWAARNKLLVAVDRSFHTFAITGQMPPSTLHIIQRLVWIELQLGRVPHVLQALVWGGVVARLTDISGTRKFKYDEEVQKQEAVLGILLLKIPFEISSSVERLPDAFERLGLTNARAALLYVLGNEKRIFKEKYFSESTTSVELDSLFLEWVEQPAAEDIPATPTLIEANKARLKSVILGTEFVIVTPSDATSLGLAESVLGALECFLATSDESNVVPHSERTTILLSISDSLETVPELLVESSSGGDAQIIRPRNMMLDTAEKMSRFSDWLRQTIVELTAHRFMISDHEGWLRRLGEDERAFARAVVLGDILTVGRNIAGYDAKVRLTDWIEDNDKIYECQRDGPWHIFDTKISPSEETSQMSYGEGPAPKEISDTSQRKHTERQVISPINVPLWDRAKWRGAGFATAEGVIPIVAMLFADGQAGRQIFEGWRARWEKEDKLDELRVVIVLGLSARNPTHYAISIGPNLSHRTNSQAKTFVTVSRINRMTPQTSENLDRFVRAFRLHGRYFLAPATMGPQPDIDMESVIGKSHLHIRNAWEIGENDPDMMVLDEDDDPFIPPTVVDAPVLKALERAKARGRTK
jgi:hypothetical protein